MHRPIPATAHTRSPRSHGQPIPRGTASRTTPVWLVWLVPLRWTEQHRCEGHSSQPFETTFLQLPESKKGGEAPPLPISRLQWFCFSYFEGRDKKKKKRIKKTEFLHKNVAAHTVPGSVSSSSGHFRNPPVLLFCMVKEQNKESKDFYFIHHLIFAWETLLIEWACLFCQVPFIIIYGL